MNKHQESTGPADGQQITLRGPAELADALPYLMGFHPDDSVVMVALHGDRGRFGGRLRLGIPRAPGEWGAVAAQLAESLIAGSERREGRPDAILIFLCQDSPDGASGRVTMERLRPFAQSLRTACGALDVPVPEALCISDGHYWSYCCPDVRCCPPEGKPLAMPGTTVMAAAAAYAGIQVRGTLRDMEARLTPWQPRTTAAAQLRALDRAAPSLVARILNDRAKAQVAEETLTLARTLMGRLGGMPPAPEAVSDVGDDQAIDDEEAAAVILGLQDRETRDKRPPGWRAPTATTPCGSGAPSPAAASARTANTRRPAHPGGLGLLVHRRRARRPRRPDDGPPCGPALHLRPTPAPRLQRGPRPGDPAPLLAWGGTGGWSRRGSRGGGRDRVAWGGRGPDAVR